MRSLFHNLKILFFAAAGLFCLIYFFGLIILWGRPSRPPAYKPGEVHAIESARDVSFDPDDVPVLHRRVDYAEGENAMWFPRGEAPVLAELVEEGKLPPVHERVGPEPAVMEGVEGIGVYGGTWHRVSDSEGDVFSVMGGRMAGSHYLRWSPLGFPVEPHLIKDWEASDDEREFILHLRRGVRWSDGHPLTADDFVYYWEYEREYFGWREFFQQIRGELPSAEKIDDYTFRISFPHPYGSFPEMMATNSRHWVSPEHYLRRVHPEYGDTDKIERLMEVTGAASPRSAYMQARNPRNPEHPRLWPWVLRTHQRSPPYTFVRNPYYWVVDSEGNQLPYVDQVSVDVRERGMVAVAASSGEVTMQQRGIHFSDYTLYMEQRELGGYDVYHWYPGVRSNFVLYPNINRRVEPENPATKWKHHFFNEKRFRQALSLAIDRERINNVLNFGLTEPAQVDPGPESPFHHPRLFKAFVEHDPVRANELLDGMGLDKRDAEGYRTFPDGTPMTFLLNTSGYYTDLGPAYFIMEDWAEAGVRAVLFNRALQLTNAMRFALEHDFSIMMSETEFVTLIEPESYVPVRMWCKFAPGYGRWYQYGGMYGDPRADALPEHLAIPEDHPLWHASVLYEEAKSISGTERQAEVFRGVLDIAADNLWTISLTTPPPQPVIVKEGFRNVPRNAMVGFTFLSPANAGIETFFFEEPQEHSPGVKARLKSSMIEVSPDPRRTIDGGNPGEDSPGARNGRAVGDIIRFLVYGILALGVLLVVTRHPFIARRLLILVPTLFVISIVVYTIIELPPGDYIEYEMLRLSMAGDEAALQEIEDLRRVFHLDESAFSRYLRWVGLRWFVTFQDGDRGLLQGELGMSMQYMRPVRELVGDRILLTVVIALFTVVFTWIVALPIGIYSAVKQYSPGDYLFTFLGFLGLSIPNFLLALLLMFVGLNFFGIHVGGLFSPEYAVQPGWTWGKFVDLLQHLWIPVVVVGTAGTANQIRVMRANLLDELKKPYVVTARAKGVSPLKLLIKYPVRVAVNPFISSLGNIFPQLISGGAIVALILSLPTVGPLQLSALRNLDMYLAGSMLMILSLLAVMGTLVSDLLLMWVDPRIRMRGN